MPNQAREQAMWVSTGDPRTVNDGRLLQPGQLGRYVTVKNPTAPAAGGSVEAGRDKTFRYVQVDSTSVAPYLGAVAWWTDKSRFRVGLSATNRNSRAGVFGGVITPGNFGYIQTGGPATTKFIDAPTATPNVAGRAVIPSATDGKADCLAVGTAPTHNLLGWIATTPNYNGSDVTAVVELDIVDNP
jgi:hypothetical protein